MSSAPKPAAAKPAAAKAPAKAAAKGKGAVKPVVKRTELRKKNKTPLVPKIVDPVVKAAQDKAQQVAKAARELRKKQKAAARVAHDTFIKAVADAKKKGVAPPVKVRKVANKDAKKVKKPSKYAANQKFYLKLTPLNEKFHTKFGFIFSELMGKSREKALCARNIHVAVTNVKHPLFGRVGKLRYYTGKHKAFVKIGHVMYKLPWSILGRSRLVHAERARRAHRLRHANRVNNYRNHVKANKKNPKVKVPAKPVRTELKPAPKTIYGKTKRFLKSQEKRKKAGKPVAKTAVAKKAAAPAANAAPAVPFPNVGRPLKNRKAALRAAVSAERKKQRAELKKAGKAPKRVNHRKYRRENKGKTAAKPAAAAGAKTAAKPATKA